MIRAFAVGVVLSIASLAQAYSADDGHVWVQNAVVSALADKGLTVTKSDVQITSATALPPVLHEGESSPVNFAWKVRVAHPDGPPVEIEGRSAANISNHDWVEWHVGSTQITKTNAAADRIFSWATMDKQARAQSLLRGQQRMARVASLKHSAEASFANALHAAGASHVPAIKADYDPALDHVVVQTEGAFKLGKRWVSGRAEVKLEGESHDLKLGAVSPTYRPESLGLLAKWRASRAAKLATAARLRTR